MNRSITVYLSLGVLTAFVGGCVAPAGNAPQGFLYSVKVVCTSAQAPIQLPQAVGRAFASETQESSGTAVNIHNFGRSPVQISYRAVQPRSGTAPSAVFDPVRGRNRFRCYRWGMT